MRRSGSSRRRCRICKPGSCIIGTTSEQAYDPSPDLYDYAQTKAATMNYVKSLAKQLGPKGIRVNGVAPGPIWTPLQISGGAPEQKYEKFGGTTVAWRAPASPRSWPPSTCSSPTMTPASRPANLRLRRGAGAALSDHFWRGGVSVAPGSISRPSRCARVAMRRARATLRTSS